MTFLRCKGETLMRAWGPLAILLICLPATALPATGRAQASASNAGGDRLVAQIIDCQGITEPDRRLECYDRQVTTLSDARRSRSVIVLSRSDIADKKREMFGLQQPAVTMLDNNGTNTPNITKIDSTVHRIALLGRDRLTIHLVNGSVWQTLERASLTPDVGDDIHIRRAALGSFIGSYQGRSIRLKRLR